MKQLLIAVLLLSGAASAQEVGEGLTGRAFNGQFWQLLQANEKNIYIGAFHEGLGLGMTMTAAGPYDADKLADQYFAKGFGPTEMVKGLDQFYADAANTRVPIFVAMRWFREKCRGRSAAQLEELASAYRASAERETGGAAEKK